MNRFLNFLYYIRQMDDPFSYGLWMGQAIAAQCTARPEHSLEGWEVAYIRNIVMARMRGVSA